MDNKKIIDKINIHKHEVVNRDVKLALRGTAISFKMIPVKKYNKGTFSLHNNKQIIKINTFYVILPC